MADRPPTLDELRMLRDKGSFGIPSRFHKSICPVCGALVTNQANGTQSTLENA